MTQQQQQQQQAVPAFAVPSGAQQTPSYQHRPPQGYAQPPPPQHQAPPPQGHYPPPQPPQQQLLLPTSSAAVPPPPQQPTVPSVPPATPTSSSSSSSHAVGPPNETRKRQQPRLEDRVLVTSQQDEETVDGRIRNREAIKKIRDTWIYRQVRARQDEFTRYRKALCYIGTWNVNAKGKEEPLDDWLCCRDWGPGGQHAPDIVAVGFQEIVDLNAVNVAMDNKTQQRSMFWIDRLRATLNDAAARYGVDGGGYVLLMQKSMVGLLVAVFVRGAHERRVRYVNSSSVGVGVLGMGGNKGGVSIRLQFYDSTVCFVCTHLAAHRENVSGRNADYANVFMKTMFDVGEDAIREVIRSGSLSHWTLGSSAVGIPDHDIVFWLGDLNYRIDESMATEKVLQFSEKGVLDELRTLDQLNVERAAGRAFENFEEGPLHFPPTYKYQPGTDVYEQRPDKKLRAPAWCDRILWMAQEPSHVQQLTYRRSETPNCSDHKPVYSVMRVTIKDVIQAKREAIYDELMKLLDRYENQTLPMLGLDRVHLDFGDVRYDESVKLPIQITNTGSVVAQYRLVPKPDETGVCKPWLKASPMFGMLIPGDPAATINFTLTIDRDTAQLLNSGREVLEDILILRLENGRDYYITVKAGFARSCFGMSVDELVMYSEPIRNVPIDPIERAKKFDPAPKTALCVPKELWRVIDAIYEKGLDEPHLFVEPGIADEVRMIRESLDTGKPFPQARIHSYVEVFVSFLSSLSSPIIPAQLLPTMEIDSQNIQMTARRLLEELPPMHYNVFVYVISFFREVLQHRERNLLTATKVARVACSCLAPSSLFEDNSNSSLQKRTGIQLIILHMLETSSI